MKRPGGRRNPPPLMAAADRLGRELQHRYDVAARIETSISSRPRYSQNRVNPHGR